MTKSIDKPEGETPLQVLQRCEKEIAAAISDLINQEVCVIDPDEPRHHCAGVVSDVSFGTSVYVKVRFRRQQAIAYMPSQLTMKMLSIH